MIKYYNTVIPGLTGSKALSLEGNYFIINATEQAYYHFLIDQIGQFLYLKSEMPGLGLLIIKQEDGESSDYADWCLDKIKASYEHVEIALSEYGYLLIEEISVISNRLINFYHLFDDNLVDYLLDVEYTSKIVPHLRGFLLKNVTKTETRHKILLLQDNKLSEIAAEHKRIMENGGPSNDRETEIISRYLSEDEYKEILNEFPDYLKLNHTDVSFEDQISFCASAKEIATFVGAGAANAFVAPDDCKITLINPDTSFPFFIYHDAVDLVSDKVVHAMDPRVYPNRRDSSLAIQIIRETSV